MMSLHDPNSKVGKVTSNVFHVSSWVTNWIAWKIHQDPNDPSGPCFEALIHVMFSDSNGSFLRGPRKNLGKTIYLIYTVNGICLNVYAAKGDCTKPTELLQQ